MRQYPLLGVHDMLQQPLLLTSACELHFDALSVMTRCSVAAAILSLMAATESFLASEPEIGSLPISITQSSQRHLSVLL
jgi:hypothetical protein